MSGIIPLAVHAAHTVTGHCLAEDPPHAEKLVSAINRLLQKDADAEVEKILNGEAKTRTLLFIRACLAHAADPSLKTRRRMRASWANLDGRDRFVILKLAVLQTDDLRVMELRIEAGDVGPLPPLVRKSLRRQEKNRARSTTRARTTRRTRAENRGGTAEERSSCRCEGFHPRCGTMGGQWLLRRYQGKAKLMFSFNFPLTHPRWSSVTFTTPGWFATIIFQGSLFSIHHVVAHSF